MIDITQKERKVLEGSLGATQIYVRRTWKEFISTKSQGEISRSKGFYEFLTKELSTNMDNIKDENNE